MARYLPKQPPSPYYGVNERGEPENFVESRRRYDADRQYEAELARKNGKKGLQNGYTTTPSTSKDGMFRHVNTDGGYNDKRTREGGMHLNVHDRETASRFPNEPVFDRQSKSRKSTFKKVISSIGKLFTLEKPSKDLYQGSQKISESTHSVRRSSSTRIGNGSVRRNHSFSGSSHERPRLNMPTASITPTTSTAPRVKSRQMMSPDDVYSSPTRETVLTRQNLPLLGGLFNVGNSCYINSVVHLLANIDKFARMFVTNKYARYFARNYEANGGQVRTRSSPSVSVALATLLQSLWFNTNVNSAFNNFVSVCADVSRVYGVGAQQDAQEFLMWILGEVHNELLNPNCPKHAVIKNNLQSIEMLAKKSLAAENKGCSIVSTIFTAQFVSPLVCNSCKAHNCNFEPFKTVSLTVHSSDTHALYHVVSISFDMVLTRNKVPVRVPSFNANVHELLQSAEGIPMLSERLWMPVLQSSSGTLQILSGRTLLPTTTNRPLYLMECPLVLDQKGWVAVVCSIATGIGYDSQSHGPPFVFVAHHDFQLRKILLDAFARATDLIKSNFESYNYSPSNIKVFINDKMVNDETYPVRNAQVNQDGVMTMIIKVSRELSALIFKKYEDNVVDYTEKPYVTLEQLLDDFVKPEKLPRICPSCSNNVCDKRFSFFSLPPILVFHVKRFTLVDGESRRIPKPVKIPTKGLNMGPYKYQNKVNTNGYGRCETEAEVGVVELDDIQREDLLYDLIGVLNHYGVNVNTGHYSTLVKNPIDGKWRIFDDDKMIPYDMEDSYVTSDAYMLVYQRKQRPSISARVKPAELHWFDRINPEITQSVRGYEEKKETPNYKSLPRQIPNGSHHDDLSKAKSVQNLAKTHI